MTNKSLDNILSNNFFDFWSNFLFFLVLRTQKINEVIGNPIDGIIIQIVCWHHLLLTMENLPSEEQKSASFDKKQLISFFCSQDFGSILAPRRLPKRHPKRTQNRSQTDPKLI